MKILIVSSKLPYPPHDGGAIATLNMATGLAEQGAEVTLFAVNTKKHYSNPANLPAEITDLLTIYTVALDTSIRPLPLLTNLLFSRRPYISERFRHPSVSRALSKILSEDTFDIIQAEGPYMMQFHTLFRKYSNAQVVLRAHNLEHEIWLRKSRGEAHPLRRIYTRILARRIRHQEIEMARAADLTVPISERDATCFSALVPGVKTFTVPAGMSIPENDASIAAPAEDLFFIGSLDWLPNQEGVLWFADRVMPRLTAKTEIHIAGRNAPPELISRLKKRAVRFHGEVESSATFIGEHGIMLAPLLTGSGIRIKILEGMAMGKPIVTTTIGAEGLDAKHGEHLFIADDPDEFANHLKQLLADPDLRERIGNNARNFVQEKFDTFALASRLASYYRTLT